MLRNRNNSEKKPWLAKAVVYMADFTGSFIGAEGKDLK